MRTEQIRAAKLVAQGAGNEAVASELGLSARTVSRWKRLPAFRAAVSRETSPTVRATLEAALQATKRDGTPDWATRVQAAKALSALPDEPPETQPTVVTIYAEQPA